MIEDKATEKLKKRLQDWGLIVNASSDQPEPKNKSEDKQDLRNRSTRRGAVRSSKG